jgi:hypothetical protein
MTDSQGDKVKANYDLHWKVQETQKYCAVDLITASEQNLHFESIP